MGAQDRSVLEFAFEAGMCSRIAPSAMQTNFDDQGRPFFTGPADATVLSDGDVRAALESVRR